MAYVETTLREGSVLADLGSLLEQNGWTRVKSFKKVAYTQNFINPMAAIQDSTLLNFAVARHVIYKNASGVYYGIAKAYQFSNYAKDVPYRPADNPQDEAPLKTWIADKYKEFGKDAAIYTYMADDIPTVNEGESFGCAVDVDIMRGAIDIETEQSVYEMAGSTYIFKYSKSYTDRQQSPFVKISLRNPNLTKTDVATNWWPDSLIQFMGYIDAEMVFAVLQADNTPAFQNNVVPSIPFFMGTFQSFKDSDDGDQALWAGTALDNGGDESKSHLFDFKSPTPYRNALDYMPVQKTYPNYPGNGVDNIIVKRGELGARYQAYFFAWSSAPEGMAPDRVGKDGGQYPQSWNTAENDEYKYKFNPSVYSQKIHTSRAYIIHPDEGVRGYIPKMVIMSPFGLVNKDKLKVRTGSCPDTFDIYRFYLTSAISPVSKRPGTQYTPAGIGIFEKSI